jgi:beta-phosphoglucomutase-like phosphatase (HAD superfamily)
MGLAVIFDMDGVLVENIDFHVDSWLMTYKKHGKILTREEILPYFGASNKIFVSHFLGIEDDASVAVIAKEKEELYRQIFNDHIRIPNGLKNLLDELKKNNIPT